MSLKDIHKIKQIVSTHFNNFQLGTSPAFGDETIFLSEVSNEIEQYIIKRGKYSKKNMDNKEKLLDMEIGCDEVWIGGCGIKRVYGGWIYMFHSEIDDTITSSVFVPEVTNCDVNINK